MRYVSGGIDWQELKFHPKFERFLKAKIGSYDEYIERLEKLCSVVFAFTFMIVFVLVSFGMWFLFVGAFVQLIIQGIIEPLLPELLVEIIGVTCLIIFLITGIIYFLDFLTLGWLKRKKWASRIYYPIYRFYSFITLANLYRPIYYNLIDHKYGRNISRLLIPYILGVFFVLSFDVEYHPHYPIDNDDYNLLTPLNYDDERVNLKAIVNRISIPSKYVSNGFLEIFINYNNNRNNDMMDKICPDLQPLREVGIQSDFIIDFNLSNDNEDKALSTDSSLACLSQLYQIIVDDSLILTPKFRYYSYPNYGEKGLKTIIDVNYLKRGEYVLEVNFQNAVNDSVFWEELETVPFWKE